MAKLYYRYGAMNSGKTTALLQVAFNYNERGMRVLILKASVDTKGGDHIVSRLGVSHKVDVLVSPDMDILDIVRADTAAHGSAPACVLCDESQFFTAAQAESLFMVTVELSVPVIAYGLRADFQNNFFEGSQWLMAWADTIEEIKTICWCGRKATCNARVVDGRVVQEGEQVVLGGNGQYVSLCRKHFRRGELGDFKDLHLGED